MIIKFIKPKRGSENKGGNKVDGLIKYLFGPGENNEHVDPWVVAGAVDFMPDWPDPTGNDISSEKPNVADIIPGLNEYLNEFTPDDVPPNSRHIKHFVISCRPEEKQYDHYDWNNVCEEFVRFMGIDWNEDTNKNCRWAAINHGRNKAGADHIHLVVNSFNQTNSQWKDSNVAYRCQEAVLHLQNEFSFISPMPSREFKRSKTNYTKDEWTEYAKTIASEKYNIENGAGAFDKLNSHDQNYYSDKIKEYELPRRELERKVRECAGAANSEDEFIRRLRKQGVLIKPRFDKNNATEVVGYSVTFNRKNRLMKWNERQYWYGGNKLANDLSIKRLRDEWSNRSDPSEVEDKNILQENHHTSNEAYDEWVAALKHRKTVHGNESFGPMSNEEILRVNEQLKTFRDTLNNAMKGDDPINLTRTCRYVGACFSGLARKFPDDSGMFAKAADEINWQASTKNNATYRGKVDLPYQYLRGAIRVVASETTDYSAMLIMMKTVMEITQITLENRRLEQEIHESRREWKMLDSQISKTLNFEKDDISIDLGSRIETDLIIDDIKRANLVEKVEKEKLIRAVFENEPSEDNLPDETEYDWNNYLRDKEAQTERFKNR